MDNYERNNRIGEALAMRGMKQVELSEYTGIKKASINGWVKNRWQPKQEAIYKIAAVLDVNEMWLAGYDVPIERKKRESEVELISDRDRRILAYASLLSDSQLDTVEAMLKGLVDKEE